MRGKMFSKEGGKIRDRRCWRAFLWLLVGVACVMAASRGWRAVRSRQVERAIGRFEAEPSQAGADRLLRLLSKEAATEDQGGRALKLLLWPEVTTRAGYPAGKTAKVAVATPFLLEVPNGRIEMKRILWREGERRYEWPGRVTSRLSTAPEILAPCMGAKAPGIHHSEIHYACQLTKLEGRSSHWSRWRGRLWRLLGRRGKMMVASFEEMYTCQFTLPVTVRIVGATEAERLEVVSDAELGAAVRAAFTTGPVRTHSVYWTDSGRRHCDGTTEILCRPLPVGVAFELSLRLADGRELPKNEIRPRQKIRLRAGRPGRFAVQPGPFGIVEPGKYSGQLVMRPDFDHAYEDPGIKRVWGGTLELPISFTISTDPDISH